MARSMLLRVHFDNAYVPISRSQSIVGRFHLYLIAVLTEWIDTGGSQSDAVGQVQGIAMRHFVISCQVRVYSGRGSGQVRTKTDEGRGQRFGQRLARAGVATDWIQQQGQRALIPCVGSGQVETETETDKGTGVVT